ncbi:hypothetical protein J6590_055657 [Homalodisca vitripennis]|nr:hypothetical protein J6590_055657 [Homalodisca vitripennis]
MGHCGRYAENVYKETATPAESHLSAHQMRATYNHFCLGDVLCCLCESCSVPPPHVSELLHSEPQLSRSFCTDRHLLVVDKGLIRHETEKLSIPES